jgi:peptide/nickel transport system permease protein
LLVRHVLPNSIGVLAVQLGATGGAIVVSEAALSFVGLGPRGGVSLGSALEQGVACMLFAPHVMAVAAVAIVATSASVIAAGRAIE